MTPRAARQQLATDLAGVGVQVYERTVAAVTPPCVVLNPSGWRRQANCSAAYDVELVVLTGGTDTVDALDRAEALAWDVWEALAAHGWLLGAAKPPQLVTWNGTEYPSVTLGATRLI